MNLLHIRIERLQLVANTWKIWLDQTRFYMIRHICYYKSLLCKDEFFYPEVQCCNCSVVCLIPQSWVGLSFLLLSSFSISFVYFIVFIWMCAVALHYLLFIFDDDSVLPHSDVRAFGHGWTVMFVPNLLIYRLSTWMFKTMLVIAPKSMARYKHPVLQWWDGHQITYESLSNQ